MTHMSEKEMLMLAWMWWDWETNEAAEHLGQDVMRTGTCDHDIIFGKQTFWLKSCRGSAV